MSKLVFKSRQPNYVQENKIAYYRVRVSAQSYNRIIEIAEKSGEKFKDVADKMIEYAYDNIEFK